MYFQVQYAVFFHAGQLLNVYIDSSYIFCSKHSHLIKSQTTAAQTVNKLMTQLKLS